MRTKCCLFNNAFFYYNMKFIKLAHNFLKKSSSFSLVRFLRKLKKLPFWQQFVKTVNSEIKSKHYSKSSN